MNEVNNTQEKIARWTIGHTNNAGLECLQRSINTFTDLYDVKVVICHNCPAKDLSQITDNMSVELHDQQQYLNDRIEPKGVAWKLYPPKITTTAHEIQIDNDIVFEDWIEEIDYFFANDCTLLLEASSRNYGRFDKHVPPQFNINSGIFGMPPDFKLQKYIDFHVNTEWEENATGKHAASKTFDEQGLVAFSLLDYNKFVIIPETSVTNCENNLLPGKGMHFVGLNRNKNHVPFRLYRSQKTKMFL